MVTACLFLADEKSGSEQATERRGGSRLTGLPAFLGICCFVKSLPRMELAGSG